MGFYTYMWLRDDGTPYYVGKGSGERAYRRKSLPPERIIVQDHESEVDAFEAEKFLIAFFGRKDKGTGILRNMTDGGEGSAGFIPKFTSEWRAKIGAAHRGKTISLSQREAQRTAMLGRKPTLETIFKLTQARRKFANTPAFKRTLSLRVSDSGNPMAGKDSFC